MAKVTVLFLGAGKLWQLMRCFQIDSAALPVDIELHSLELEPCCPIAHLAQVHTGPNFSAPDADQFILDLATRIGAEIVIPNMDSATIVLGRIKDRLAAKGITAVVSELRLCEAMFDKITAETWFEGHGDSRPLPTHTAPAIAKHRYGYASKGIHVLPTQLDVNSFLERPDAGNYLIQEYLDGDEFTVDAYVARDGRVVDILTRQRLLVEAGIVVNSITRWDEGTIRASESILSRPGWSGPITLQFRLQDGKAKILEINPRLGGGVTHSIHCGLRMPMWILQEHLGLTIAHEPYRWQRGSLMTRARIDIFHDHLRRP